jgi:integrase
MKPTGRKTKKGNDEYEHVLDDQGSKKRLTIKNPTYQYYLEIYQKDATPQRYYDFLPIFNYPDDTEKTKVENFRLANLIRANKEHDIAASKLAGYVPESNSKVVFVDYAKKEYLPTYDNKDIRKVEAAITHFQKYLESRKPATPQLTMVQFDVNVAKGFVNYLKKKSGLTGETPLSYLKKLKAVVKYAFDTHYLKVNPFSTIGLKDLKVENQINKEFLEHDEVAKLYNTPCNNELVKRAFILGCYSGMGMAEMRTLKWSQLDFENKLLSYTRAKTGKPVKNHLHPIIEKVLFGLERTNELVFNNQLPSDNGINKSLKTWVKKAGIKKHITFYCSRHTFGCLTHNESKDLVVTAKTMGHKNTLYTEVYAKALENADIKAVASIPDVSEMG